MTIFPGSESTDGPQDPYTWQGGTARADRPFLGAIAGVYEDLRPGYSDNLVASVLDYSGSPAAATEVGAGTGKATVGFVRRGVEVQCIEPDPDMANVLRRRFESKRVHVLQTSLEQWEPRAQESLIYCAQAWHWVDPTSRCKTAYEALRPGGALALFGHRFLLADKDLEAISDDVYRKFAPHLLGDPSTRGVAASEYWYTTELRQSGLYVDVQAELFDTVIDYDLRSYLKLISTFSSHRAIPAAQLAELIRALGLALRNVEVVGVQLGTILTLGRRAPAGVARQAASYASPVGPCSTSHGGLATARDDHSVRPSVPLAQLK